jgi:lipoprotein-releasing system permease protein
MLGIALGVAALIIVLSVMNGFQKEVRDRMLSMVAHIEIYEAKGLPLPNWQTTAAEAAKNPAVQAAAPFINGQALIARGEDMRGVVVRGVLPSEESKVTPLAAKLQSGVLSQLTPGTWNVLIGQELAKNLGARDGDRLTLVTPNGQVTPAGVVPRMKQVTIAGTFDVGHYQYDSAYVMMHVDDVAKLFRTTGPTGVQLRLTHQEDARRVAAELQTQMGSDVIVSDWTRTNREWFAATQVEKRMMFIILTLIVAVAAFNLVSSLVMTVTDKRADIAILRTLGASPRSIMGIFMVQGAVSGVIGTLGGLGFGLLVACNIDLIVPAIERLLHMSFLPSSIYLLSNMPSEPMASDIVPILLISLVLAFIATLYPSWRASRVQPAEALRYE